MWVFLSNAFLSIVAYQPRAGEERQPHEPHALHRPDEYLLVRARVKGDIERVFDGRAAVHTPDADYPYRTILHRSVVATAMHREIATLDYPNFKASVEEADRELAAHRVWSVMRDLQERRELSGLQPGREQPRPPRRRKRRPERPDVVGSIDIFDDTMARARARLQPEPNLGPDPEEWP